MIMIERWENTKKTDENKMWKTISVLWPWSELNHEIIVHVPSSNENAYNSWSLMQLLDDA